MMGSQTTIAEPGYEDIIKKDTTKQIEDMKQSTSIVAIGTTPATTQTTTPCEDGHPSIINDDQSKHGKKPTRCQEDDEKFKNQSQQPQEEPVDSGLKKEFPFRKQGNLDATKVPPETEKDFSVPRRGERCHEDNEKQKRQEFEKMNESLAKLQSQVEEVQETLLKTSTIERKLMKKEQDLEETKKALRAHEKMLSKREETLSVAEEKQKKMNALIHEQKANLEKKEKKLSTEQEKIDKCLKRTKEEKENLKREKVKFQREKDKFQREKCQLNKSKRKVELEKIHIAKKELEIAKKNDKIKIDRQQLQRDRVDLQRLQYFKESNRKVESRQKQKIVGEEKNKKDKQNLTDYADEHCQKFKKSTGKTDIDGASASKESTTGQLKADKKAQKHMEPICQSQVKDEISKMTNFQKEAEKDEEFNIPCGNKEKDSQMAVSETSDTEFEDMKPDVDAHGSGASGGKIAGDIETSVNVDRDDKAGGIKAACKMESVRNPKVDEKPPGDTQVHYKSPSDPEVEGKAPGESEVDEMALKDTKVYEKVSRVVKIYENMPSASEFDEKAPGELEEDDEILSDVEVDKKVPNDSKIDKKVLGGSEVDENVPHDSEVTEKAAGGVEICEETGHEKSTSDGSDDGHFEVTNDVKAIEDDTIGASDQRTEDNCKSRSTCITKTEDQEINKLKGKKSNDSWNCNKAKDQKLTGKKPSGPDDATNSSDFATAEIHQNPEKASNFNVAKTSTSDLAIAEIHQNPNEALKLKGTETKATSSKVGTAEINQYTEKISNIEADTTADKVEHHEPLSPSTAKSQQRPGHTFHLDENKMQHKMPSGSTTTNEQEENLHHQEVILKRKTSLGLRGADKHENPDQTTPTDSVTNQYPESPDRDMHQRNSRGDNTIPKFILPGHAIFDRGKVLNPHTTGATNQEQRYYPPGKLAQLVLQELGQESESKSLPPAKHGILNVYAFPDYSEYEEEEELYSQEVSIHDEGILVNDIAHMNGLVCGQLLSGQQIVQSNQSPNNNSSSNNQGQIQQAQNQDTINSEDEESDNTEEQLNMEKK